MMASALCSCFNNVSVSDLPYSVINKICQSLDTDKRGWENLAGECGYTFDQIQLFGLEYQRHAGSPARSLFLDLCSINMKVDTMYNKLNQCNRRRESDVLAQHLAKLCKCNEMVDDYDKGGTSGPVSSDSNSTESSFSDTDYRKHNNQYKDLPHPKPPFKCKPDLNKDKDLNFNSQQQLPDIKALKKNLAYLDIKPSCADSIAQGPLSYQSLPQPQSSTDNNSYGCSRISHSLSDISRITSGISSSVPYTSKTSENSSNGSASSGSCACSHTEKVEKSLLAEVGVDMSGATTYDSISLTAMSDTPQFTYKELSVATEGFSELLKIGEGAFGVVYRGIIKHTNVAVKKLYNKPDKANGESFRNHLSNEIKTLRKYPHENIVLLYGYLVDDADVCLVYQYMENGSVEDRLQCKLNTPPLSWNSRINIGVGAARGLQYLHTMDPSRPIIHGDIKSANILLDRHMEAKIGDFGLAQHATSGSCSDKLTHITRKEMDTKLYGTKAYLPPEFHSSNGQISLKTDTYSFGVVLFELCTGLKPCDENRSEKFLADYIDSFLDDRKLEKCSVEKLNNLKDSNLEIPQNTHWSFKRMMVDAFRCTEQRKKDRPSMVKVYERLQELSDDWSKWMEENGGSHHLPPSFSPCHITADPADVNKETNLHLNVGHAHVHGVRSPRSGSPLFPSIPVMLQHIYDQRNNSLQTDCDEEKQIQKEDHVYANIEDVERYDSKQMLQKDKFGIELDTNVEEPIYECIDDLKKFASDPNKLSSMEEFDRDCEYQCHPHKLAEMEKFEQKISNFQPDQFKDASFNLPKENVERDFGSLTTNLNKLEKLLNEEETLKSFHKVDKNCPIFSEESGNIGTNDRTDSAKSGDDVSEVTYQMGHENKNTIIYNRQEAENISKPRKTKSKMYDFFESYSSLSQQENVSETESACENSDLSGMETLDISNDLNDMAPSNHISGSNTLEPQECTWATENVDIIHHC